MEKQKRKPRHYVNNKDLFETLVKYREKRKTNENTPIPNYVGECLMLICERLSTKPNFIGYTYREEMIGDAIENCIMAVNGFNPEKSNNPFAYFTQIAWNAFIRRLQREKKQTYIKHKNMQKLEMENPYGEFVNTGVNQNDLSDNIISDYEEKNNLNKEKKPRKKRTKKEEETFEENIGEDYE